MKFSTFKNSAMLSVRGLVMGASLVATVLGTTACDSDDARVIGGTIAIVAGAIAIDRATDDHRSCRGAYVPECHSIRDRWGRLHRSCSGRVWHPCASRFSSTGFTPAADSVLAASLVGTPLESSDQSQLTTQASAVNQIAMKYNLPLESAERLTTILQEASAGNIAALSSMGLSSDEMKRVATYRMPSDAALDKIGSTLALSREMARGLVQQLMDETKVQMADVTSPAWTACQAKGKWKTNANGGTCKSVDWPGCSPETGASMCASL